VPELILSIGIGLVVSLLCTELFGIASAGMIVPGYLAIYVTKPTHILLTLAVATATYVVVRLLSTFLIIYGRRRTVIMILIGFLLGAATSHWARTLGLQTTTIGYIIPGLIAIWMDRQSIPQTLASLAIVTGIVRLILVLVVGTELLT
jgi:poly-gamma-glutamate biosynthesis protein PgsC/CapC